MSAGRSWTVWAHWCCRRHASSRCKSLQTCARSASTTPLSAGLLIGGKNVQEEREHIVSAPLPLPCPLHSQKQLNCICSALRAHVPRHKNHHEYRGMRSGFAADMNVLIATPGRLLQPHGRDARLRLRKRARAGARRGRPLHGPRLPGRDGRHPAEPAAGSGRRCFSARRSPKSARWQSASSSHAVSSRRRGCNTVCPRPRSRARTLRKQVSGLPPQATCNTELEK